MQILTDINPIRAQVRPEQLQGFALVRGNVASVIDHHVESAHLSHRLFEESTVRLRADPNLSVSTIEFLTARIDIDPEHDRFRPKISAPERQGPSLRHADLEQPKRASSKPRQVSIVNREVVSPLVNDQTVVLVEERV